MGESRLIAQRLEGVTHSCMNTLLTAEAVSIGGRSGCLQSPSKLLNITLSLE